MSVLSVRMTTFAYSFRDYPWLTRQEEMFDFRTVPPDISMSRLGSGSPCTLHLLLLPSDPSDLLTSFAQLVMQTASQVRLSPGEDRFLIHFPHNISAKT